jgi:hypothetical protein
VGCCCGIIPASLAFSVHAVTSKRRLEESSVDLDTCGRAYQESAADIDAMVREIQKTSEGASILQAYDKDLKAAYPSFFSNCNARRLGISNDIEGCPFGTMLHRCLDTYSLT